MTATAYPTGKAAPALRKIWTIILKAWEEDRFSYEGEFYRIDDLCVLPKPYQKPHPPVRIAATTRDTFPQVGQTGHSVISGLRGFDVNEVEDHMQMYHEGRARSGSRRQG